MVKGLVIVVILAALVVGGFKYLPGAFQNWRGAAAQHQLQLSKV